MLFNTFNIYKHNHIKSIIHMGILGVRLLLYLGKFMGCTREDPNGGTSNDNILNVVVSNFDG